VRNLGSKKAVTVYLITLLLLTYIGVPHILAKPVEDQRKIGPLRVRKISGNIFSIETEGLDLKIIVEEVSKSHTRLRYSNKTGEMMTVDIVKKGRQTKIIVNGLEAYTLSLDNIPVLQSNNGTIAQSAINTISNIYYWWDGVRFVKGQYIKYPHPDRDYYGVSPYRDWKIAGNKLYHNHDE